MCRDFADAQTREGSLLPEQLHLTSIRGDGFAAPVRTTNDCQHGERGQRPAWNKDTLRVGTHVRGIDEVSLCQRLVEIIRHHAFQNFVVLELETDPKTLSSGAAGEGLAAKGVGVGKLPHEVNPLDVFNVYANHVAGNVQQLQLPFADKVCRADISVHRVAVELADDYFLVGRRHWSTELGSDTEPGR